MRSPSSLPELRDMAGRLAKSPPGDRGSPEKLSRPAAPAHSGKNSDQLQGAPGVSSSRPEFRSEPDRLAKSLPAIEEARRLPRPAGPARSGKKSDQL